MTAASRRGRGLERFEPRTLDLADLHGSIVEHHAEYDDGDEQGDRGAHVPGPEVADGGGIAEQREDGGNHDDRVHARTLPVAAAQVQPHPELVEGERESDTVAQSTATQGLAAW